MTRMRLSSAATAAHSRSGLARSTSEASPNVCPKPWQGRTEGRNEETETGTKTETKRRDGVRLIGMGEDSVSNEVRPID